MENVNVHGLNMIDQTLMEFVGFATLMAVPLVLAITPRIAIDAMTHRPQYKTDAASALKGRN